MLTTAKQAVGSHSHFLSAKMRKSKTNLDGQKKLFYYTNMAQINILTSSYNGKLGTTYGIKQYNKHFVKAIPFSHAPRTEIQKESLSAFTKLNKVCSQIVKKYWQFLGLSDKKMYKNNALTQKLKTLINNKVFGPLNIYSVYQQSSTIQINQTDIDNDKNVITVNFIDNEIIKNNFKKQFLMIVFSENAITYINEVTDKQNFFFTKNVSNTENAYYYFLVLSTKYKGNQKIIESKILKLKNNKYVLNGVWYVLRLYWYNEPYVDNETLYLKDEELQMTGETLVIL